MILLEHPPKEIETKFDWLRELMPWPLLIGTLICTAEETFGYCEFAKAFFDQDQELATLQLWATIQKQYDLEQAHLISAGIM